MTYRHEVDMYPDIIDSIKKIMNLYGYEYEVFETWHEFPVRFKEKYQAESEILSDFGKPDITVFFNKDGQEKVLIIEVKLNAIIMKDIAQAKMYGDIYNADEVFLVSPCDLQNKIINYYGINKNIFAYSDNRVIKYVSFKDKNLQVQNAFPPEGSLL